MGVSKVRPTRRMACVCDAALAQGIPRSVVEEARDATVRRFPAKTGSARTEAYFWGVVRRRAMRGEAPVAHARLLVASLAAELCDAGHGAEAVFEELRRVYGGVAGADAIEAYRPAPAPGRAA